MAQVSVSLDPAVWAAVTITCAGAIAGVGYLGRKVKTLYQYVHAGFVLVHRELAENGGRSMKDDVTGLSVSYGVMARFVDDIDRRLMEHIEGSDEECPKSLSGE